MPQSARKIINDRITHYRLVTALAKQEELCEPVIGAGLRLRNRMSLTSIAKAMNVPVVLATFRDEHGVLTFATHGLGLMNNLAHFAAMCDELCRERVVVIPDTRTDATLAALARHWPSDDICFLVGIPLRDSGGKRVGSLAVMNNSRAVARCGISFRTLSDVGKAFSETGRLQPEFAKI
jgi:GAF domain-containing protein